MKLATGKVVKGNPKIGASGWLAFIIASFAAKIAFKLLASHFTSTQSSLVDLAFFIGEAASTTAMAALLFFFISKKCGSNYGATISLTAIYFLESFGLNGLMRDAGRTSAEISNARNIAFIVPTLLAVGIYFAITYIVGLSKNKRQSG